MKFNGATFNKAQQDQLKKKVGAELDDVIAKVDDVDSRMLNYTGDWVTGNEYHENDVVTWTDGHLYEVIKAHTSSSRIDPSNTTYYKAMTATKYYSKTYILSSGKAAAVNDVKNAISTNHRAFCFVNGANNSNVRLEFNEVKTSSGAPSVVANGLHRSSVDFFPAIIQYFLSAQTAELTETTLSTTGATKQTLTQNSAITIYYEP